jgi:hypothetical protein
MAVVDLPYMKVLFNTLSINPTKSFIAAFYVNAGKNISIHLVFHSPPQEES